MQKMMVISAEQYDRMLKSYDEAMEELFDLREQLQAITESDSLPQPPQGDFVIPESMMKHARSDEAITLRLIRSRLRSREEVVAISQQKEEDCADED